MVGLFESRIGQEKAGLKVVRIFTFHANMAIIGKLTRMQDISQIKGLSEQEALEKQHQYGVNELPSAKPRNFFSLAFQVIREPMFILLLVAGTLYLLVGDIKEALLLLSFVFIVMGITFYQENKTEKALYALKRLSSPRALVIRDKMEKRIAGRDVVVGDILVLKEGDRVPADGVVLFGVNLSVDESLLTGESVPVRKISQEDTNISHPDEKKEHSWVYSGTLVVQGHGVVEVCAIGIQTELGKIGTILKRTAPEKTALQLETASLVKNIAILGFTLCLLVILADGFLRGHWIEGFLAGITLAMAILPEEIPVILTVFLALGAWRMSKENILTRNPQAIEMLGSATVLCVDKTGTLTLNKMSLTRVFASGAFYDIQSHLNDPFPEQFHEVLEFGILASQKDPFDPMERSLKDLGNKLLVHTEHLHHDWALVHEYPLSEELLAMSHVWQSPDEKKYFIAAKGSPEAVIDLCHLEQIQTQQILVQVGEMAKDGLRVLGVARAYFQHPDLPHHQHDFNFEFLGLLGFIDPIRPAVPEALSACRQAKIRVVMITGDYPATAQHIAREIGLAPAEEVLTGTEIEEISEPKLQDKIKSVAIFARIVPEQKLQLVNAFKANGDVVAMTGDGVNDSPALKSAHIGIAMGGRGTDVARESASLVLLDDDFTSIVHAIRMGRRIFDNLKKAIAYIVAIHIPIAGLSLIPVLFNLPLILLPAHIVFLQLIIDPVCSIVFEAEVEEKNIMSRPPRDIQSPIFNKTLLGFGALQGGGILMIILGVYISSLYRGLTAKDARTISFTLLVLANLILILINRSRTQSLWVTLKSKNPAFWWVSGGALVALGCILYIPVLRNLFQFSFLHPIDLLVCLGAGMIILGWLKGITLFQNRRLTS